MKKKVLFIIFLLFLVGVAMAKNSPNKIFPYSYTTKDLPNGLRVVIIPNENPNVLSVQITVRVGSRNEVEPGKSGFAHFFEHMMFRGTEKYPNEKYNEVLKNIGADHNAYTNDDYTNYYINCPNCSSKELETILELEADRFMNLKYSLEDFKTESRAVLGEYNKNASNPINKLIEVQRDHAFKEHTYKHTTMGFLKDIEDMPNQYEYSQKFFDRFYRPEYTSIIISGNAKSAKVFKLVEKHFGPWKKGTFSSKIVDEPAHTGPVYQHIPWDAPTLPIVSVAFHGPAFSAEEKTMATFDVIAGLSFSESSPLYQKLVVRQQIVDELYYFFPNQKDPYLVTVFAHVKEAKDIWYVRDEILKTFAKLHYESTPENLVARVRDNLKFSFTRNLTNATTIAESLIEPIAFTKDPEAVNKVYALYEKVRSDDILRIAKNYVIDKNLVVVTLSHDKLPDVKSKTNSIDVIVKNAGEKRKALEFVEHKTKEPVIDFRILFNVGSAFDPKGKEGLAELTAKLITEGSSQSMTYQEIQKAFFPMAAFFSNQLDKEMTVYQGRIHKDNLSDYYAIIRDMLLTPAFNVDDFKRVKEQLINEITVSLRQNNDEELGKEVLYEFIYSDHPYGHLNLGHVQGLRSITFDDVKTFYKKYYTQKNINFGITGDYEETFKNQINRDFEQLDKGEKTKLPRRKPKSLKGFEAVVVEKETRATAISFGFPITLNRSHKDFVALLVAGSYLGQHRSSNSYLFQRIREIRGMNYGDYAYIEYFPNGMYLMQPEPNYGRQEEIFQIWIRPVKPENAHFATRIAIYELRKLIKDGISQEDFTATKNFLSKYVSILTNTNSRKLGYDLDSRYYDIAEFTEVVRDGLRALKIEDVNSVIKKYLQADAIKFVFITKDANDLKKRLVENTPSAITYDAAKPNEILEEDKIIENYHLDFKENKVKIIPVKDVFVKKLF